MTLRMDPHVLAQLLQQKPNGLVQHGIVVDPADTVDVHYFIVSVPGREGLGSSWKHNPTLSIENALT